MKRSQIPRPGHNCQLDTKDLLTSNHCTFERRSPAVLKASSVPPPPTQPKTKEKTALNIITSPQHIPTKHWNYQGMNLSGSNWLDPKILPTQTMHYLLAY